LPIPNVSSISVSRVLTVAHICRNVLPLYRALLLLLAFAVTAAAADWNEPEQQLARKIIAVTGPGAVALTVNNRSSLGKRDNEVIQNGLRIELEALGIRFVTAEQAAATVAISLSENSTSYVWVAQVRQGTGEPVVVMVSTPRPPGAAVAHESVPLTLRKILLWTQGDRILDVAAFDDNAMPTHIAVLDAEKVAFYRSQSGNWQQEQTLGIIHAHPWPRDLRGKLILGKDHLLLSVYLPGVVCRSLTAAALNCRDTDDPWPLVPAASIGGTGTAFQLSSSTAIPTVGAFYAPTRNFFTGVLTPGIGKFTAVSKFYSAAFLPRDKYVLWLFAATDGSLHMVDGVSDQVARLDWGSDITSVSTSCGAGRQVLATGPTANSEEITGDAVRAYEFPDRDPIAVSPALDFPGAITALWTEEKGDTAIAVAKNRETGNYEAYRVAAACNP
jgi:hypothetical protein